LKNALLDNKILFIIDRDMGLEVSFAPPPVSVKDILLSFPPRFGEHNEEIFGGLGYDVGELKEDGVI
jgi:hypothetical protein